MNRIVYPGGSGGEPAAVTASVSVKSEMSQKQRIEKQRMREPAQAPSPTAESEQSREKSPADENAWRKGDPLHQPCDASIPPAPNRKAASNSNSPRRWIPQGRIRAISWRAPHRGGLVDRRIDHLRIGRRDLDRALAILILG